MARSATRRRRLASGSVGDDSGFAEVGELSVSKPDHLSLHDMGFDFVLIENHAASWASRRFQLSIMHFKQWLNHVADDFRLAHLTFLDQEFVDRRGNVPGGSDPNAK